jgi:hypothetical protein
MVRVEVSSDRLTVHIEGFDRMWTFRSRLEVPLAHVTGAAVAPEVVRGRKGWRGPGVHIPGVIVAGTYHLRGERVFWVVHEPAKAVVVDLTEEKYARLVVGVTDPPGTVAEIREVLRARDARA